MLPSGWQNIILRESLGRVRVIKRQRDRQTYRQRNKEFGRKRIFHGLICLDLIEISVSQIKNILFRAH